MYTKSVIQYVLGKSIKIQQNKKRNVVTSWKITAFFRFKSNDVGINEVLREANGGE